MPAGYKLSCIDDVDIGKVESVKGGAAFNWVREMQFSGPWLLVAPDTGWHEHVPQTDQSEDKWDIVDTRTQVDEAF